jgi:predicted nucleotide-binding protein (sugar kinase/HSP70/actin superfamily)
MKGKPDGLEKRTIFIHPMTYTGARAMAAVLQSLGLDGRVIGPSDEKTHELGSMHASGEECYPLIITIGDMLRLFFVQGMKPEETAILMPTSNGPCRFGQYAPFLRKVLGEVGLEDVLILSPTCEDGYGSFENYVGRVKKPAWLGIVAADILRKVLLMHRPYEVNRGDAEKLFDSSLDLVCETIIGTGKHPEKCLKGLMGCLEKVRDDFAAMPVRKEKRPLIGVVGEIFCRLNRYSNMDVIKKVEELGGEAWQSDVAEWIWYTDRENKRILKRLGKTFSREMIGAKMKYLYQKRAEHALYSIFKDTFSGREEPGDVSDVLKLASPYLKQGGALGEMILSVGKSVYYMKKGALGVIDISPFSCMNGIVSESIYYKLSADLGGFPIKIFYFDETHRDIDFDLEIFMEIARDFGNRERVKPISRVS